MRLIGIRAEGLDSYQEKDGYIIVRTIPTSFHVKIVDSIARHRETKGRAPFLPLFLASIVFHVLATKSM